MLIIIDKRIPEDAKNNLSNYGELFELETSNNVYDTISGHPDIFIFQHNNDLIIAPQSPQNLIDKLVEKNISFQTGINNLGIKYPETAFYNVANNADIFIGNIKSCDESIINCAIGKLWIQTKQSYSRCNNIILNSTSIITNDNKVHKQIETSLYINPEEIILTGFDYGFIGGCAGITDNKVFLIGSLKHHSQGKIITEYIKATNHEIVELYDGPLFDGGGIIFVK